jgi:hypothetical protein
LPTLPQSLTYLIIFKCNGSFTSSCRTIGHANWLKISHITEKRII